LPRERRERTERLAVWWMGAAAAAAKKKHREKSQQKKIECAAHNKIYGHSIPPLDVFLSLLSFIPRIRIF
jgi:hypothetical protein